MKRKKKQKRKREKTDGWKDQLTRTNLLIAYEKKRKTKMADANLILLTTLFLFLLNNYDNHQTQSHWDHKTQHELQEALKCFVNHRRRRQIQIFHFMLHSHRPECCVQERAQRGFMNAHPAGGVHTKPHTQVLTGRRFFFFCVFNCLLAFACLLQQRLSVQSQSSTNPTNLCPDLLL